ncbi:GGDEF-domain containing protein [Cohaesibacter celericrescens]|uniref:GGDEF-domain containing protein n=1 Tax=Cohaesibacter celericrescens TaxID=2067669 RepID=A0A2N5XR09_9HYPH|nr:GGDEF-domain containing protein [Cohaesibacter celericrescens]
MVVSLPLIFLSVSYKNEKDHLSFLAHLGAQKISTYIYVNGALWDYQGARLSELVHLNASSEKQFDQTAFTLDGKVIFGGEGALSWFTAEQSADILRAGEPVGRLRVRTSILPMFIDTGLVATFAAIIALLAYVAIRYWPLRFINQTLTRIQLAQKNKSEALESLKKTKRALADRTERLLEAQKIGKIGDWSLNLADNVFFLSAVTRSMFKVTNSDEHRSWDDLSKQISERDRDLFEEAVKHAIKTCGSASLDLDVTLGDFTTVRMSVSFAAVPDKSGKPYKITGTIQDISERREAEIQLENLAYFDPLTGLANRTMFKRELADISRRLDRGENASGALFLLDLDRFKEVNDSLGHAAGDELLCKVSQQISQKFRGESFCARLGGDEFAVILRETDVDVVNTYADQLIEAISQPFMIANGKVSISTSIGVATFPSDGTNHETLITHADLALYRAKELGRGQFARFAPEMSAVAIRKMALAHDLREAVKKEDELQVWFQPQIDIHHDKIVGFEALMRWEHPEMGFISPTEFIPLAESSSLICDVGHWVLSESVRVAKRWIDEGNPPYEVAVNVSAAQIWQGSIEYEIADILRETGLPPHLLCIELTESLFVDHAEFSVRQTLGKLKALGVTLALDDFGTGYSSLGYLIQLPFDKLKIDRVFVAEAHKSERMQHILKGIIALGKGLGMVIVAEGVETPMELALLKDLDCDQIQGFLYARPAPRDVIIQTTKRAMARQRSAA